MLARALSALPRFAFAALTIPALAACGEPTASEEAFNTEGQPLAYDKYEVLFTNPTCKEYPYDEEVVSVDGETLAAKPKDAFCSHLDSAASGSRPESPQYRLIEWIKDPSTTEIFFTYLSFSSSAVSKALCSAVKDRGVKLTFVLDSSSDTAKATELLACTGPNGEKPRFEKRGHTPGIGYAHNKMFVVNPGQETMRISFSSGNMSSGTVTHHENWHFITLPSKTYFAQAHLCMMNAELDAYQSKTAYRNYLKSCIGEIEAPQESDIQAYFVPGDDGNASKALINAIYDAESIDVAAHRFSYTKMVKALKSVLQSGQATMRLVADDDMYWAGQGEKVGDNLEFEYWNVESLVNRGAEVEWMETNHAEHLLHHNKFLIFDMPEGEKDAVFCGAGNLTGTGFSENWENYYFVTIPEVVEAYKKQYAHLWNDLATAPGRMPERNVLPPTE